MAEEAGVEICRESSVLGGLTIHTIITCYIDSPLHIYFGQKLLFFSPRTVLRGRECATEGRSPQAALSPNRHSLELIHVSNPQR